MTDFEELLAVLDLDQLDDDTFIGAHPSKNPMRTFGGQMMAQAFVAAGRSLKYPTCRPARCRCTSSPAATPSSISSSMSCGCATSVASPTAASTSCRTGSC